MAIFRQANAPRFTFTIGSTELLVVDFTFREQISIPYETNLNLAATDEITFDDAIGKPALLTIAGGDADRHVHGIVDKFIQVGMNGRFYLYQARIVPQVQLLSLAQDCRIFQNKTVPDIVKEVLQDSGITSDLFEFRLQGSYTPREYCVQYRESDLTFISRLLEEEGIFYFFEHSDEKHLMVFGDGTVNYQPIAGQAEVIFNAGGAMVAEEEAVFAFQLSRQIRSGKVTVKDFNFERPSLNLTSDHADEENTGLEVYDYPGEYAMPETGQKIAQIRLQQAVMYKETASGSSVVPRLTPGFTFRLTSHAMDALNREYLLVAVDHTGSQPQVLAERAAADSRTAYDNTFLAIPSSVTVRPEKSGAKPLVEGVQTAIVSGPSGEEIYTDKHGRVKVQFHWDRQGRQDDKSSCWIRVSQAWAGAGWGAMFIPRIGQEVIVDFIEGDPDRPIITGRVYHGTNSPPYNLPAEKTKSTLKSNSSIGGGGFNELRFEDKKDSEEIYLHAQKDWSIAVRNDKRQTVGHDDALSVGNNRNQDITKDLSETVGRHKSVTVGENQSEVIGGNTTLQVGKDSAEAIGQKSTVNIGASKSLTIGGDYQTSVSGKISADAGGNLTQNAGGNLTAQAASDIDINAGSNIQVKAGGKGVISVGDSLTIQCGAAKIMLKSSGNIDIIGNKISIKGSGDVIVKGASIKEN